MITLALALALSLAQDMEAVLDGVRCVESSCGTNAVDGDLHQPYCERSWGEYQVTARAVRHLVDVGALSADEIPGFSHTRCEGIRRWVKVPENGRRAASLYLLLVEREVGSDIDAILCGYNAGPYSGVRRCGYADDVKAFILEGRH